jgi:hypothetical protein
MPGKRHELRAYSAYPYSKDARDVYRRARDFFYAFKNGRSYRPRDLSFDDVLVAIARAVERCPAFAEPAVLVPVPRSGSSRESFERDACKHPCLALARLLAERTPHLAVQELLARATAVPRASDTPERVSVDQHCQSLRSRPLAVAQPGPATDRLVLVDDIVTKGTQLMACYLALRRAGHLGPIEAVCVSQTVAPDPGEEQLRPYLEHRIRWREGHALASRDDLGQWREGDLRD